ncbi:hypothetical protein GTQ40_04370 [Flavobacteriaceae bacterium R38]|nr:hypothetical protein [Flavobacteriaceae bacterium R38]
MNTLKLAKPGLITYGLPLFIILSSVSLAMSPLLKKIPELAIGITYDLTLITPLVYLFLIWKKKTPNITAIPFFVIGVLLATFLIPSQEQFHLNLIKTYVAPLVPLTVVSIVVYKVYQELISIKADSIKIEDKYLLFKRISKAVVPNARVARVMASEAALIYYSIFSWKSRKVTKDQFTNYKESGVISLLLGLILVIIIETFVLHALLIEWNEIVAWIFTLSSIYVIFQIIGHLKALVRRLSEIKEDRLIFKNGLLGDINIRLDEIEYIEMTTKEVESDKKVAYLTLSKGIDNHNVVIYFNRTQQVEKIYGTVKECEILLLHVDNKDRFVNRINECIAINQKSNIK